MWSLSVFRARGGIKLLVGIAVYLLAIFLLTGRLVAETPQTATAPAAAAAPAQPPAAPTAAPPATPAAAATAPTEAPKAKLPIVYLGKAYPEPLPLSYAERLIKDKGIQGARLYIKEANQSGGFVGMGFDLVEAIVPAKGDVVAKAKGFSRMETRLSSPIQPEDLLAVADLPEAKNSVIMNIRSSQVALRQEQCGRTSFTLFQTGPCAPTPSHNI